jgi:hypothetical protein
MPQLSQYDSVDSLSSSAKEIFMANASVPAFGPTEQGGSNGNYNIPVSEIGSSLPAISAGDGGKVLTVNSNEDGATWDDVPGELPAIGASDAGKVLTVNSNSDDVVWATPGGGGSSSEYTVNSYSPTNADVHDKAYTINLANKTLNYLNLSGITYGSYSSDFEFVDLKLPSIESGEYIDIVIQITNPGDDDFRPRVYDTSNNIITNCINLTGDVKSYDSYFGEKKLQVHILGQFYTLCWVGDIEMQGGGGD